MIKSFLAALVLVFSLSTTSPTLADDDESKCTAGTYSGLVANVQERQADMQKLSGEKFKQMLAILKESNGLEIDADYMLISHIADGPINKVGIVLMKGACVVPGSMGVLEAAEYVNFLNRMKLEWTDFEMVIAPEEA